jgi:hypothetical protein
MNTYIFNQKFTIFFSGVFIFSACHKHSPQVPVTPIPVDKCSPFMGFIKDNWVLVDRNVYGIRSDTALRKESIRMFRENANSCLKGMSKSQIFELFGTPSRTDKGTPEYYTVYYYLKNECNHPVSGCVQLKIKIRRSVDTVIKVYPMITEFVDY